MMNKKMIKKSIVDTLCRTQIGRDFWLQRRIRKLVFEFRLSDQDVRQAENHPEEKKRILDKHLSKWSKKADRINTIIDKILDVVPELAQGEGNTLREDMLFCYFAYGITPHEYVCYEFQQKRPDARRTYISDRDSVLYAYRMNDYYSREVFWDKMETYKQFKPFYKREAVCVSARADYSNYMSFCERHAEFVKKEVSESCGRGVSLVDLRKDGQGADSQFEQMMDGNKYILEELVVQSDAMARLNPSSVNTVRCLTLNTHHGIVIPWCFMKVGRMGSFVDNGGAGGILVGIDMETGRLFEDGVDEYGRRYLAHPDTGTVFSGYPLPDWDEMLAMCKKMAIMTPKIQWIGWDLANTDQGWVVIEGNVASEVIGPQSTTKHGIRSELDEYMTDMDFFMK